MSSETKEDNPEEEVDIQFKPVIQLQPVDVKLLEDDEEEVFKMRARLFRFDSVAEPAEWKERGVGDMRMLKHKTSSRIRLLMRREKVLKICCNHFLTRAMKLKPHASSDRSFVWVTFADFADEEPKAEHLAIRFRDAENAKAFKSKFEELQQHVVDEPVEKGKGDSSEKDLTSEAAEEVSKKLDELKVTEPSGDSR
ncbi:ran-specific GTPase-activating protein-like [Watersipora subatra]|uniref:ran-specific GTPase-activating protein-like n=1 Tax=Watersipora subatra TaxID=2589382 RepID=UPI00355B386C